MSDQVFVSQGNTWSLIIDVCIAHISQEVLEKSCPNTEQSVSL